MDRPAAKPVSIPTFRPPMTKSSSLVAKLRTEWAVQVENRNLCNMGISPSVRAITIPGCFVAADW
jgi:hypothetical protein